HQLDIGLLDVRGQQPGLAGVALENIREAGGEDNAETVVHQRPDGVLTGGAGAEVRPRDQHGSVLKRILVEDEVRALAPAGEQAVFEARAGDSLQVYGGDDLVGVDVGAHQRRGDTGVGVEFFHGVASFVGSVGEFVGDVFALKGRRG